MAVRILARIAAAGTAAVLLVSPSAARSGQEETPLIAYACMLRQNLDLCAMSVDGSVHRRLAGTSGADVGPVWSPDGKRIAFLCHWDRDSDNPTLPIRDIVGFGIVGIARNGGGEVCIVDADGGNLRTLTKSGLHAVAPVWSPNGAEIAFATGVGPISTGSSAPRRQGIFAVDSSSGNLRQLTSVSGDDFPAWSPDGTLVAFTRGTGIAVVSSSGAGLRVLTRQRSDQDVGPSWSPDGARLAFTRYTSAENRETWVMNADGSGRRRLTRSPAFDEENDIGLDFTPRWSPDGTSLAVVTTRAGRGTRWFQIAVVPADRGPARNVTPTPRSTRDLGSLLPSWAPDGARLAFISDHDGRDFEIYSIAPDGTGLARLTDDASEQFEPAWQPATPAA